MKNSKGNETMQAKLQRKSTRVVRRAALLLALGGALTAASTRVRAQNAAVVYPTDSTNIAAASNGGRVLNASSTLDNDPKFSADNLIDGKVYSAADKSSFGWASNRFDPINLDTVTFGFEGNTLRHIGKIVINPSAAVAPERWAKDIEVQVSTTSAEGPYTPVAQITLKREAVPQSFTILPAEARYVRLAFRTNWGSDRAVALGEVAMYEAIDKNDAIGQLIARLESAVTDLKRFRDTQLEVSEATLTRTAASTRAPLGDAEIRETAAPTKNEPLNNATLQTVQAMGETVATATAASTRGDIAAASNGGQIVDVTSVFNNDPTYGPDKLIDGLNFNLKAGTGSSGWASNSFTPGREWVTSRVPRRPHTRHRQSRF